MNQNEYTVILPQSARGIKEFRNLFQRRKKQVLKAIEKLKKYPTNLSKQGIEKLEDNEVGSYSIRVSRGDRIIYDVNLRKREVILLRAGTHDLYKLIR